MKERRVKANRPTLSIDTEVKVVEQFDTESFDRIDAANLRKLFGSAYTEHVKFIMELVTSRAALDTAMLNVDNAVKEHMNGSVSIHETKTVTAIDTAFDIAIRLYAYDKAFGFLDSDTRKEVLINVLSNGRAAGVGGGAGKGKEAPIGRAAGHSGDDLNKTIRAMEERLTNAIGGQPNNPYGEGENPRGKAEKKKVGVSSQRVRKR